MGLTDYTHTSLDPVGDAMAALTLSRLKRGPLRDPLGCSRSHLFRYAAARNELNGKTWGCNCNAYQNPAAAHLDLCAVTPEFAYVSREFRQFTKDLGTGECSIWGWSSMIGLSRWQLSWDDWDEVKEQFGWEEDNGNQV